MSSGKSFSRRRFLLTGGIVLGGSIYLAKAPFRRFVAGYIAEMDLPSGIKEFAPDFWFEITSNNTVVLKSPKAEMGQDIFTGFAMLAAEELDVEPDQISVVPGSTASGPVDTAGTGGSSTTASLYVPLREVAATLRETLKLAASKKWNVSPASIASKKGVLSSGSSSASYAEIARGVEEWVIADTPELRPEATFKYVGKQQARLDLEAKVRALPIYGLDAELPGMAYAMVLYSPYIDATLTQLKTAATEAVPGVIQVVQEAGTVAVVAHTRYAAEMGKRALEAEWHAEHVWGQSDIDGLVTVGDGPSVNVQEDGNARKEFERLQSESLPAGESSMVALESEFRTPLAAHAHMEPNGVVAEVRPDGATLLTGTQIPLTVQKEVAKELGLKTDQVEVRNCFLGGGFGRRYHRNNAREAVVVARAVGRPVHVFKDREDEFRAGYLRPNTHHVLRGVLNGEGRIHALEHLQASGDMLLEHSPLKAVKPLLGGDVISAGHGLRFFYDAEHRRAELWHKTLPFQTGIWRGVGMFTNTFPTECFIDEMAEAARVDPLEFRLEHLRSGGPVIDRMRGVLEAAADASGWRQERSREDSQRGWGIACAEDRKTVVAAVAQVEVVEGRIRVRRVTQAIDPGVLIHPEGVRAQVEGATMMAVSATLFEEVKVVDGQIEPTNFHQYLLATMADAPEVEVVLLAGGDAPSGVGEPPIAPVAPAIANAVFDLTGQRLRQLPLRLT